MNAKYTTTITKDGILNVLELNGGEYRELLVDSKWGIESMWPGIASQLEVLGCYDMDFVEVIETGDAYEIWEYIVQND